MYSAGITPPDLLWDEVITAAVIYIVAAIKWIGRKDAKAVKAVKSVRTFDITFIWRLRPTPYFSFAIFRVCNKLQINLIN